MADPKTRAEVLDWGVRKIGGGKVVIELEDNDVDDAFDDAIRWYVARKGIQRRAIVNLIPGVQEERLQPEDLAQAATVEAIFVYNTAMRDQMLPRKPVPHPEYRMV